MNYLSQSINKNDCINRSVVNFDNLYGFGCMAHTGGMLGAGNFLLSFLNTSNTFLKNKLKLFEKSLVYFLHALNRSFKFCFVCSGIKISIQNRGNHVWKAMR
jgi:hypothetical protein